MARIFKIWAIVLTLSMFMASVAHAASFWSPGWGNEYTGVTKIQFWVTDSDISIKKAKFNGAPLSGWEWTLNADGSSAIYRGPDTPHKFSVDTSLMFNTPDRNKQFSVEWAEVTHTGEIITGVAYYNKQADRKWTYESGPISQAPTPIPGAFLLFGGGLSLLAFFRKKFLRS